MLAFFISNTFFITEYQQQNGGNRGGRSNNSWGCRGLNDGRYRLQCQIYYKTEHDAIICYIIGTQPNFLHLLYFEILIVILLWCVRNDLKLNEKNIICKKLYLNTTMRLKLVAVCKSPQSRIGGLPNPNQDWSHECLDYMIVTNWWLHLFLKEQTGDFMEFTFKYLSRFVLLYVLIHKNRHQRRTCIQLSTFIFIFSFLLTLA